MTDSRGDVTQMLLAWSAGDEAAGDRLMEVIYDELRQLAAGYLRGERVGHSLDPTALVNEAFLRLVDVNAIEWRNRQQFIGLAARTMRRVLVDHARRKSYQKRGGRGQVRIPLEQVEYLRSARPAELIALDDSLKELAELDPGKAQIVELRYFGGFNADEIARHMKISVATVNRHWRMARAWLHTRLRADGGNAENDE